MTNRTVVISDVHGAGLELEALLSNFNKKIDLAIMVGDLFDRGMHSYLVWEIIKDWGDRIFCLCGNHERKMLKWLKGERKDLPPHYYWAMNDLYKHGVKKEELIGFLEGLPTIITWNYGTIFSRGENGVSWDVCGVGNLTAEFNTNSVIITHAGIDINNPLNPEPKYTVYGDGADIKKKNNWWDKYNGQNLVIYGHLSEKDCKPRIKHWMGLFGKVCVHPPLVNSIGLDTAAVHGGYLTGYVIETKEFISIKARTDWATELKRIMPKYNNLGEEV